ncbi:MAG: hypothetical protein JO154_14420 [Chitinophaga sp.]|uniref:hypothetical protein n=1 Tax=Chitinophaga sp. TaxID=1869181 RepID=UPI0025C3F745|nr:hypothetical protein [Chitinophaga sp.]MBV8253800.1 hypothetical protein [Chitinophaga sp.]
MNDIYLHQFKKGLQQIHWEHADLVTPDAIALHWNNFVQECQGVYAGSVFDFDEGIVFRSMMEKILEDRELRVYPSFMDFVDTVHKTDNTFSALTVDARAGEFWWERALLRDTGPLYKEQIQLYYGIVFL